MKFTMAYGGVLEIKPSRDVHEDVDWDEHIEGLYWQVWWNGNKFPWECTTKNQAIAIALGAQWSCIHTVSWSY